MRYYTNIGVGGPLKYHDVPGSLGVLEAPDRHMPIGQADCRGPDDQGRAVFRLRVGGRPLPGDWVIVGGEFVEVGARPGSGVMGDGLPPRPGPTMEP